MNTFTHYATLALVSFVAGFVASFVTAYILNRFFPLPRHWSRKP